ncbi:amidoligase family protein [Nitrosophilus labii]|uniref:amidoligase family protein n=1 Tax=Nitrosophilus labii TaxID=2706014 RepID=UPI0016571777|nr:amidoligase family protein [Nitrosophilus labii]
MDGFSLPPLLKNQEGKIRKAGFEIEFSGLTPTQSAATIIELFGGRAQYEQEHSLIVKETLFGDFKIYIDSKLLQDYEKNKKNGDKKFFEDLLFFVSEIFIPYEIVTPPIPFDRLDEIDYLREKLKGRGALGTKSSAFYAFGLHINIETPSLELKHILNIFRAFLILYDWIKEKDNIDLTRKLSWFIEPFDKEYILLVMASNYTPDFKKLIDDYIRFNPTRNRALDMLPLFAYLDKEVKKKLPNEKITPRPAFHYRLPNSRIDEDIWSIAYEFNYWALIEKLAFDENRLYILSKEYRDFLESPFWFITSMWVKRVDTILNDRGII